MEKDKVCKRCRHRKPVSEYYKSKLGKDNLMSWCRSCFKKYMRERYATATKNEVVQRKKKEHSSSVAVVAP